MEVPTKRFGIVNVDESKILHFPDGLIGFPDYREYIVLDLDKGGFLKWLQSVDEASLEGCDPGSQGAVCETMILCLLQAILDA